MSGNIFLVLMIIEQEKKGRKKGIRQFYFCAVVVVIVVATSCVLRGLGAGFQVMWSKRKKKKIREREREKRKESSEKAGNGLHVAACEEKIQICRGMSLSMPRYDNHIIFFMWTGNGLHATACVPYVAAWPGNTTIMSRHVLSMPKHVHLAFSYKSGRK